MARAMVLCAGFGTRLRPLTDELPKPLLPFGDRSFLEHACDAYRAAGFAEVVANVHHLSREFEKCLSKFNGALRLVYEPVLRGTAGGIAGARSCLGPAPVVALIGDVVPEAIPADFAESASFGGLVLAIAPRLPREGTVGVGARGDVVRLRGECFGTEVSGGDYVGLCALGAVALEQLPDAGCLIGDYALPLLRRGGEVRTRIVRGRFTLPGDDLGSFLKSQLAWLGERNLQSYVGERAQIESGVVLEQALVGASATVQGSGRLTRVIVLPGASARAPLADAIVAPSGRVISVVDSIGYGSFSG